MDPLIATLGGLAFAGVIFWMHLRIDALEAQIYALETRLDMLKRRGR